jgi:hypothetical protein
MTMMGSPDFLRFFFLPHFFLSLRYTPLPSLLVIFLQIPAISNLSVVSSPRNRTGP